MNSNLFSRLWVLIRREIWESQFAFKWTPLIIAGLNILVTILILIIGAKVDDQMVFTIDGLRMFAGMDDQKQREIATGALFSTGSMFHFVMLLVVVFYLAGSLYDDRRDRSILFWKSLPVSDQMTVLSKILTAMVAAPVIYLGGIALTQLVLLLIASGYGLAAGINIFTEIWLPANLPKVWLVTLLGGLAQSLWLLPIFGWLMLCSSFAPRLPILIAVAIPALVGIFQHFWSFFSNFRLPDFNLGLIIVQRLFRGILPMSIDVEGMQSGDPEQVTADALLSLESIARVVWSLEMWIGVAIGLALLAGAVWFRRRATDA